MNSRGIVSNPRIQEIVLKASDGIVLRELYLFFCSIDIYIYASMHICAGL
jgi:hypothetical protein